MPVSETSTTTTVVVANAATVSAAIDLGAFTLAGIQMPAAITSTTMTFQVSVAGSTYVPLTIIGDDGTPTVASIAVAASIGYSLPFSWFAQWSYAKLVMGTAEGAERTIALAIVAV